MRDCMGCAENLKIAFVFYCGVIVWAFARFLIDPTEFYRFGRARLSSIIWLTL